MRQKSIEEPDDSEREIARIGWKEQKEILEMLAGGKHRLTRLAAKYNTDEKNIHRIRAKAIERFALVKRELPVGVQNYLRLWAERHGKELLEKSPREISKERIEQHKDDLCRAAEKVYPELSECCAWPPHMTIEEINLERNDPQLVGLFLDVVVVGLLDHLKASVDELKYLDRWEDLKSADITSTLLSSISTKAAKREFSGTCGICRDWG